VYEVEQSVREVLDYIFTYEKRFNSLLESLKLSSDTVIFGGKLRDIARSYLFPTDQTLEDLVYSSDFDIVVQCGNKKLLSILEPFDYELTQLGGFRLKIGKIRVDLWDVRSTWAYLFRQYEGNARTLENLVETTFFKWDSIIYHLNDEYIHTSPYYWRDLRSNIVDLNFSKSHNPYSSSMRIIRYLLKGFSISEKSAQYLRDNFIGKDTREKSTSRKSSFSDITLREEDQLRIKDLVSENRLLYSLAPIQLELFSRKNEIRS
jgi:hypothetical protein